MSYEGWWNDYDWSILFPYTHVEGSIEWYCDAYDKCWYFDEGLQQSCDSEGICYHPEEALEIYFSEHGQEYDIYIELEDTMLWTMYEEMLAQEMPIIDEEAYIGMFYPVFEQKWYELVDES